MGLKKQRGFAALVSLLLALGIVALLIGLASRVLAHKWRADRMRVEGQALAQLATGIRGFAAAIQETPSKLPSNPYTQTGVDWLKPPTCGGLPTNPAAGYVPCAYHGETFGPLYSTTVTYTVGSGAVESRTTFIVPGMNDGPSGRMLFADGVVQAALGQQSSSGTFYAAFANTAQTATAAANPAVLPAAANQGRVLLVINNAPSNDIWLRVDGTNKMLANLDMGGHSLTNARDGTFSGGLTSATVESGKVSVGAGDQSAALNVHGTAKVDGATTLGGTLTANAGIVVKPGSGDTAVDATGKIAADDFFIRGINAMASQAVYYWQNFQGTSATVPKITCPPGLTAKAFATLAGTGAPGANQTLKSSTVTVTDNGSSWTVKPVVRAANFTPSMSFNGNTGVVTANLQITESDVSASAQAAGLIAQKCD